MEVVAAIWLAICGGDCCHQSAVPVVANGTPEELAKRVLHEVLVLEKNILSIYFHISEDFICFFHFFGF